MKRVHAAIFGITLALSTPSFAQAGPREMFVQSEHADVFDAPSRGRQRANRIYARQAVTVYEVRNGWAQLSAPGYTQRWVEMRFLGPVRPPEPPPVRSSAIFSDPRIENGALPTRPGDGLDARGVEMVWRAARRALDQGCRGIYGGDRSVSRPDTFFISCDGENRNRFYTGTELSKP